MKRVFAFVLVVTALLLAAISMLTPPPAEHTLRYTWYGATSNERVSTRASWSTSDVVASLIVLLVVLLFYVAFW